MVDLKSFIEQARTKGLDDQQIKQALVNQGWDEARITVALTGLEIPKADQPAATPSHAKRPSLSPLLAALHHVLLWLFTGSSTVTITGVVVSLFGENVSTQVLASMIAVTVITFIPYAILFISFLLQAKHTSGLIPGKVWSIITICIHAVAAMIAAITLVVALINSGEQSLIISASLILMLDLIVVTTYCFAAFTPERLNSMRRIITSSYLPTLGVLFGILTILSALQLGPARHDEQLRKDLATTVEKINHYTSDHKKLPEAIDTLRTNSDIEYTKTDDQTYEVCATFQTSNKNSNPSRSPYDYPQLDSYVSESTFYVINRGRHCFSFQATSLQTSQLQMRTVKPLVNL
jgi:hypothetical protein